MDDKKYEEHKKNIKGLFPFLLFGAFFIILVVMVLTVAAKNSSPKTSPDQAQSEEENTGEEDVRILAVLKEIDALAGTMTLLDTESGQDFILDYFGGTDIIDKYEKVIAAAQLTIGEMVDAYYSPDTFELSKLQISKLAWEYKGISNWSMDSTDNIITIADSKYKYSENLVITKDGLFLDPADLNEKDVLVMKGRDREIYSILVTKGHGTVRFEDYEDFIGGTAYIGNKEILPVVADMIVTVREGSYDVTLEKESFSGTKKLEVIPGEEVVLNMGEFKKPPLRTGTVRFYITPEGADLYIDNLLKDYNKAIELEYGDHSVKVELGGYTTYTGTLEIGESGKTVSIDLVESNSTENISDSDNQNTADQNREKENTDTTDNNEITGKNNSNTDTEDVSDDKDSNNADAGYEQVDADNYIYIEEPADASAYFNGKFKGTVPVSFPKETGTHYITIIKSGYKTKTYTVEIKEDEEDVTFRFPDMEESE